MLKNIITLFNSNIEFCDNSDDEMVHKYKQVFESVLNKHKTYAPTCRKIYNRLFSIFQSRCRRRRKHKLEKSSIGWEYMY